MFAEMKGTIQDVLNVNPEHTRQFMAYRQEIESALGPDTLKHMLATRYVVNLRIFGRRVPIEVDADQIELVNQ
jgi:transcription antitermination factor NusG